MANTVNIDAGLTVSDTCGSKQVKRSTSLALTGTNYVASRQVIGTAAETMAIGDCATLRYASIINPAASGATVTVTCAGIVLLPGDPAVFPPSTSLVTLQSTGASTEVAIGGVEN